MTYHEASTRAEVRGPEGGGWLVPVIGGGILTALWGAYTVMIVYHMAVLPLP